MTQQYLPQMSQPKPDIRARRYQTLPTNRSPESQEVLALDFPKEKIDQIMQLIFAYFCKKTYVNKPYTFDNLSHEVVVLSLNKFMIFCKEFGFISSRMISMIDLVSLFRRFSKNFKEMDLEQFLQALTRLGEICFKGQKDSYRSLLQFMKVDNEINFKSQMKKVKISVPQKLIQPRHVNHFKIHSQCGKFSKDIKKQLQLRKEVKAQRILNPERTPRQRQQTSRNLSRATGYSSIHENRLTRRKFQLNSIVTQARLQTELDTEPMLKYRNRIRQSEVTGCLKRLIEQEDDELLEELEKRQQIQMVYKRYSHGNALQDRVNRMTEEDRMPLHSYRRNT